MRKKKKSSNCILRLDVISRLFWQKNHSKMKNISRFFGPKNFRKVTKTIESWERKKEKNR